jgi:hypothetical protein
VSWFYFFYQFTQEALLVEALVLFAFLFFYALFWILGYKKRRFASDFHLNDRSIFYLHEILKLSECLRLEILGNQKIDANSLETRLSEQIKITNALEQDKKQLQELLAMKTALEKQVHPQEPHPTEVKTPATQEKIQELEEKIQEYTVLEADLANLKQVLEENQKLKILLENAGISSPQTPSLASTGSSTSSGPPPPTEAERDLIAEFEKMLKN